MKRIISLILIVVCIVSFLCSCSQEPQGVGETGISAEEFDKLSLGMSKETVTEIIGGNGDEISESRTDEEEYIRFTYIYRFEGETGGYAELEFTLYSYKELFKFDSTLYLTSKTQYDLK